MKALALDLSDSGLMEQRKLFFSLSPLNDIIDHEQNIIYTQADMPGTEYYYYSIHVMIMMPGLYTYYLGAPFHDNLSQH